MRVESDADRLQRYFDELLQETGAAPNTRLAHAQTSAKVIAAPSVALSHSASTMPLAHSSEATPQLKTLSADTIPVNTGNKPVAFSDERLPEQQKRQLQQLLNRQSNRVAKHNSDGEAAKKTAIKTENPIAEKNITPAPMARSQPDSAGETFEASKPKGLIPWAENGRPHWAQSRFDALLFEVAGLTLAVPLVALGHIVKLDKSLTPIFGQSDWFMGFYHSKHGNLRIVNTALFVMPEKYQEHFARNLAYAVSLDGVAWSLAVDRVNQPVSLDPDDIQWRGERTKRPWLAGTIKSAMCALLDVANMANILNQSDPQLLKK